MLSEQRWIEAVIDKRSQTAKARDAEKLRASKGIYSFVIEIQIITLEIHVGPPTSVEEAA